MKKISVVLAALMLAGCQGGPAPIDAQKFLSGLEGPKVPSMSDALVESAHEAEKQGDFKQAAQLYQQALEKQPGNKEIALSLADACRRSGQYDRAISMYDGLIAQDPPLLGAKEGKGLALMAKGDFDTPAKLFGEVMKVDDKRWKTLNALGILFTTRNMQPEAQQYFQTALKYHPDSPSIINNLGLSQALDRHYDESLATLQHAAQLAASGTPQRKRIDLNMALVYAINGKPDEAGGIARNYYSGAALDNNLGLYAHLAKDDAMAKAYLNMALTESKTFYAKAWDNLKDINETSGASPNEASAPVVADATTAAPEKAEEKSEPAPKAEVSKKKPAEKKSAKKKEKEKRKKEKEKAANKKSAIKKEESGGASSMAKPDGPTVKNLAAPSIVGVKSAPIAPLSAPPPADDISRIVGATGDTKETK